MNFKDMELSHVGNETKSVQISNDVILDVLQYLPIKDKGDLITYIVNYAIDDSTGCFSPIRLNVFYSLAIMQWYAGVEIDEADAIETYDLLEENRVLESVLKAIPEDERNFIADLVDNTIEDITRYNNSFAGMLANMSSDADNLDKSIQDILSKIKDKEGLEVLSEIKNVVGKG